MNPEKPRPFDRKDFGEIVIGSCTLALPLAVTEEVWNLGAELPLLNVALIVLASYGVIAVYVHHYFYSGNLDGRSREFVARVVSVYLVTLVASGLCLLAVDKLPLLSEPMVALKRTILTSMPATFFATVVDGMH